jgi:hypothetical protein
MNSKNKVEFQEQIETIFKQSFADLDIKVVIIFRKHAIGRLKNCIVRYYQICWLTVAQLYRLKKSDLAWTQKLQYALATVAMIWANGLTGNILFTEGFHEPEIDKRSVANCLPSALGRLYLPPTSPLTTLIPFFLDS